MNKVCLVGRITKDIELKKTQTNKSVVKFTVAVNRMMKNEQGQYIADFINCIAWNQSADFLANYGAKGSLVSLDGSIQTGSYDTANGKVYTTEVLVDRLNLLDKKEKAPAQESRSEQISLGGSSDLLGFQTDELPFY